MANTFPKIFLVPRAFFAVSLMPFLVLSGCIFRVGPNYKEAPATLSPDWM